MRTKTSALLFLVFLADSGQARAGATGSCRFIERLAGLPVQLQEVRSGRGDPDAFLLDLSTSLRAFGYREQTGVFTRGELHVMQTVADTVRKDWKLNGTSADAPKIPGLTSMSETIEKRFGAIVEKFDCQALELRSNIGFRRVGAAPFGLLSVIFAVSAKVILALGIYWLLWSRFRAKREICRVPALLHHEGMCTATTVIDISRGGVKVEAPDFQVQADRLILHLAGHSLPVKVAWSNSNFVGLTFTRLLSARQVSQIATGGDGATWPENMAEDAPACFKPGCHLRCKTHRSKSGALQNAGIPEA